MADPNPAGCIAVISIVCPCHNESDVLDTFVERLWAVLDGLEDEFEVVFVNDGSSDQTLVRLKTYQDTVHAVRILDLSRQFGKEAAMTAGIDHANGDAVIVMDVDLQDPPEAIPALLDKWREGFDVVAARRADRRSDSAPKRLSAHIFYRLHNLIGDTMIPVDVGDYRLMDRRVVDALRDLPERQRFMKGLFAWLGFETTVIDVTRGHRAGGDSKFNWWRLWNFGLEGITSFSTAPLRIWTYIGILVSLVALIYGGGIVVKTLIFGIDVPGYASIFAAVVFLGGIQLISLGVLGEYIGRIYIETKQRPLYVIREEL